MGTIEDQSTLLVLGTEAGFQELQKTVELLDQAPLKIEMETQLIALDESAPNFWPLEVQQLLSQKDGGILVWRAEKTVVLRHWLISRHARIEGHGTPTVVNAAPGEAWLWSRESRYPQIAIHLRLKPTRNSEGSTQLQVEFCLAQREKEYDGWHEIVGSRTLQSVPDLRDGETLIYSPATMFRSVDGLSPFSGFKTRFGRFLIFISPLIARPTLYRNLGLKP